MRTLLHSSLVLTACVLVAGCSMYRSGDREDFDSSALAGAPTPKPASLLAHAECFQGDEAAIEVTSAGLDLVSREEDARVTQAGSSLTRVVIARRSSNVEPTHLALCRLEFRPGATASEIRQTSRTYVANSLETVRP